MNRLMSSYRRDCRGRGWRVPAARRYPRGHGQPDGRQASQGREGLPYWCRVIGPREHSHRRGEGCFPFGQDFESQRLFKVNDCQLIVIPSVRQAAPDPRSWPMSQVHVGYFLSRMMKDTRLISTVPFESVSILDRSRLK